MFLLSFILIHETLLKLLRFFFNFINFLVKGFDLGLLLFGLLISTGL